MLAEWTNESPLFLLCQGQYFVQIKCAFANVVSKRPISPAACVCGCLPVGISAAAIFAALAKDSCSLEWWVQPLRFALRISDLPQGSLHDEILRGNVQDALAKPSSAHWAAHWQVVKHVRSLGLPAPSSKKAIADDGAILIDRSSPRRHAAG